MKTKKAYELEEGDAILYKKKYFVIDMISTEFISDEICELYDIENVDKEIKVEHLVYTFEDGLTMNFKKGSENRMIYSVNYDVEFEYLGKVEYEDYEKGLYNREIRPKLRHEILTRDKSTCQKCGRGIKNGATLHIDHIIPVAKGGKTEKKNLQTLCDKCNYGKGGN
ncbi:HNH endonuclease [Mariniflexile soesokkakense]|uniref:HNH endonuclease n=1 Tax=Mariniflexile soesokkakense TaxID=1343160 RepID=A0ABV0ADE7_9FLAO